MGFAVDSQKFLQSLDAMVKTLCPGAISVHQSRIDTKAAHPHKSIYEADTTNLRFAKHLVDCRAVSRSYIREARCGEFDFTPSSAPFMETYPTLEFQSASLPNDLLHSMWKDIPRLWVLVTDLGGGTHHVSAIYRGPAVWKVVDGSGFDIASFKSDAELLEALSKIQACEGIDMQAWKQFCQKYWDTCVLDAAVIPGNCGVKN